MEIELSESIKKIISAFLLLFLPLLVILLGVIFNYFNAWFYILAITWFGSGVIFFGALN
jgi:hypothetical protein